MNPIKVCLLFACFTALTCCRKPQQSLIVRAFQDAGGGDVGKSSPDGIAQFLAQHDDVRKQITSLCAQKRSSSPEAWSTSDEGKVCVGNTRANFFAQSKFKSDGIAF